MKLGLVSVSFRNKSPRQILEAMAACGLEYIEWGSDVHVPVEKAEEIAALQKHYGIGCCSYGTYFRLGVTPLEELPRYIRAAQCLGTNILRLWCGDRHPQRYTADERQALLCDCRKAAQLAEQAGVTLCMECHMNTYTETVAGALDLMQSVSSAAFGMYWQPNQYRDVEENLAYARLLLPYIHHVHVFQWEKDQRFPLRQGLAQWQQYWALLGSRRAWLLEFMPNNTLDELPEESNALRALAGGAQ